MKVDSATLKTISCLVLTFWAQITKNIFHFNLLQVVCAKFIYQHLLGTFRLNVHVGKINTKLVLQ